MSSQPTWITITRATGLPCWRIKEWAYVGIGDECNNGGANAYLKALDAGGKFKAGDTVYWATPDEAAAIKMRPEGSLGYCYDNQGKEIPYGQAVQMTGDSSFSPDRGERGPYSAYMEGNSDRISGMGLPLKRHVQFTVVWQWVTAGEEPQPPLPPPGTAWVVESQTEERIVLVRTN